MIKNYFSSTILNSKHFQGKVLGFPQHNNKSRIHSGNQDPRQPSQSAHRSQIKIRTAAENKQLLQQPKLYAVLMTLPAEKQLL